MISAKVVHRFSHLLILLIGLIYSLKPSATSARSYSINSVTIIAQFIKDGSMLVEVRRSYNFGSSFTFAYQTIKKYPGPSTNPGRLASHQLEEIQICDGGGVG